MFIPKHLSASKVPQTLAGSEAVFGRLMHLFSGRKNLG